MFLRRSLGWFAPLALLFLFQVQGIGQDTEVDEEAALEAEEAEEAEADVVAQEEEGEEGEEGEDEVLPLSERPTLRTGALFDSSALNLDGVLSEPDWETADSITDLVTVEPEEGGAPAGRTTVKVLANSREIIIGMRADDPNPSGIVSFSKARDAELESEDHFTVVLDTFMDGRSGYVFSVNPEGARFDGLVLASDEVDSNWDAIWEARTSRDDGGWGAEIRIPIKSISFRQSLNWGFNVQRRVQRLQETSRWSAISQDYDLYQTSRAGILTDVPTFDIGAGLTVRTSLTGGVFNEPEADAAFDGDPSLDLNQRLGTNLTASFTANTDFAETEVDSRVTNLSRFEVFFPEKRSFFLEGSDIFDFGMNLGEENMLPFFSRRIGLFLEDGEGDEGIEVPINMGGKLNGRIGNTNLGALVVNTREDNDLGLSEATMGALRVRQNVFAESSVGLIATVGDQLNRENSWMTGADFTYETSEFAGEKNFAAGFWGIANGRDDLIEVGDRKAWGFGIEYPNDLLDMGLTSVRVGEGFDPSLGFVPRNAVHIWEGTVEINPRPGWRGVRQMFHEVSLYLVNDLDQHWESYEATIKPFEWLFESGDLLEFRILPQGDRPDEDFDVFESEDSTVVVPAGSYEWNRYSVGGVLAEKRTFGGELRYEAGDFYDGTLDTVEAVLAINSSLFGLELGAERNMGELPDGKFTQNLYSGRIELKVSPDLQLSSLVQFDNESNSFGSNTRLRWSFSPQGDFFVVYNHNLQRSINDFDQRVWNFDSNELLVKFQYALQL